MQEFSASGDNKTGEGSLQFKWLYNSSGLLEESFTYIEGIGEIHNKYNYNLLDSLEEEISFILGMPFSTFYKYEYNDSKKVIRKTRRDEVWYYKYDQSENLVEEKWLYMGSASPEEYFKDTYSYNSKQQIIGMVRKRADNSTYFSFNYEYDNSGNLIKEIRFESGDTTDVFTKVYDKNNNQIEDSVFDKKEGKIIMWSKTTFDDNGLIKNQVGQLSGDRKKYYREYSYEFGP